MASASGVDQAYWDAIVVGGGFYGATIAAYLKERRGFHRVALLEREPALMTAASSRNQGRIHAGYHYPRSWTTAARSRANVPRFLREHPGVTNTGVESVYAIARSQSRINARQFVRFCQEIGAPVREAPDEVNALFDVGRIEAAFMVEERVMNLPAFALAVADRLQRSGVAVYLGCTALSTRRSGGGAVSIAIAASSGPELLTARHVFHCTYSETRAAGTRHEIAELAVIAAPSALRRLAITVIDGPFFSVLPHHVEGLHTLSHVRHTPHLTWNEDPEIRPRERLERYAKESRFDRMVRDASKYLPCLRESTHLESIFEVKTVLQQNEVDDGRPILLERSMDVPGCYSILGGKIDNVYDVLDRLDAEPLT
ncbi:hypothetical protein LBMAG42_41720 [Deltaproteobacteria bacterium]|nr:hypothetical protein LBMAG42_41720 [Deltaproteobacteria bacterium]